ncbi:unknown [Clostridium sp. CAG:354]|nr:hypothetical protein [Clostridium sp.]CDE10224.1 unknown [Clostridium sp. CAG:354]
MEKEKAKKEFCIYVRNGQGKPYILSSYPSFREAFIALNNIIDYEQERGRIFYVDNDFYDNKYPPNLSGKYICIMQRTITEWQKYESSSYSTSKNKNDKIIMFRQEM